MPQLQPPISPEDQLKLDMAERAEFWRRYRLHFERQRRESRKWKGREKEYKAWVAKTLGLEE